MEGFNHSIIHFVIGQHVLVECMGDIIKCEVMNHIPTVGGWRYLLQKLNTQLQREFFGDEISAVVS